jgi:phosphatidylinositol-3-phosphatase
MLAKMPYLTGLANANAQASEMFAITHPSLPNRLADTAGSTLGISDDDYHVLSADNVLDRIRAVGKDWRLYAESMPAPCQAHDAPPYAVRHNIALYYASIVNNATLCQSHDVSFATLDSDLATGSMPALAWIEPDTQSDGHNTDPTYADNWLSTFVPQILASPAYRNGGKLIITFDEGETNAGCCNGEAAGGNIGFVALSPSGPKGYTDARTLDMYSLERTLGDLLGVTVPGAGASAPTLTNLFSGGSRVSPAPTPALASTPVPMATAIAIPTTAPVPTPTPGRQIALRGVTTTNNGGGTRTLTLALPVDVQPGDLLLAQITADVATTNVTAPAGWNAILTTRSGSSTMLASFYRVASASEPASSTWTLDAAQPAIGGISAYSGVDSAAPVDASSDRYNPNTQTVVANQVMTTTANDLIIVLVNVSGNTTVTPAAGLIEYYDVNDPSAGGSGKTAEMAGIVEASTGQTTIGNGQEDTLAVSNLVQLIALRPATAGTP